MKKTDILLAVLYQLPASFRAEVACCYSDSWKIFTAAHAGQTGFRDFSEAAEAVTAMGMEAYKAYEEINPALLMEAAENFKAGSTYSDKAVNMAAKLLNMVNSSDDYDTIATQVPYILAGLFEDAAHNYTYDVENDDLR